MTSKPCALQVAVAIAAVQTLGDKVKKDSEYDEYAVRAVDEDVDMVVNILRYLQTLPEGHNDV